VPLRRATLAEVQREGVLDGDTKALRLGGDEVSLAYFRAGYTPHDYPSEAEWEARLLIERSFAVKCPSIGQHLAGTKKVQQVLAAPAMLARFADPEQAAVLSSCFAGLHGLDEAGGAEVERAVSAAPAAPEAYPHPNPHPHPSPHPNQVSAALAAPEAYVLKPQREGGGNNLYGEEMARALGRMGAAERASYILMERITPPTHALPLMRDGVLDGGACIAELGVFGVFKHLVSRVWCPCRSNKSSLSAKTHTT
jgi:glutathione synthase